MVCASVTRWFRCGREQLGGRVDGNLPHADVPLPHPAQVPGQNAM
jgi:hypothetical protein